MFWALKSPEGREPEFCQGLRYTFYVGSHCLHVLTKFRKIQWMDQKLWTKKCHFWPIWGILGCFWPFLRPWGHNKSYFWKSENVTFYPLSCCNFMQNFRQKQWLPVEKSWRGRTHGRTDGRTHGIGWILRSQFRLKSGDQKGVGGNQVSANARITWCHIICSRMSHE